jgi:hypothetical protein
LSPSQRLLRKSLPSVCTPIVARQQLGKHVPAGKNTCNNKIIVGCLVFYTVHVVSKESLWVRLCIPNFSVCTAEAMVWRFPEPSDSKI